MATATVVDAAPQAHPGRATQLRNLLTGLFPATEARPITGRVVAFAALVVAVGAGVSLARTTGTGPFQSIWEEDARDLLTDALMHPGAWNLAEPYVGYFQIGPRLMAEVAAFFPVSMAAAVLSIQAAVVTAALALAVYVASGSHLRHPLARFLVSAPMLFSPTAENIVSEIYNRPATVQFFLAYAMFWLLLWRPARPGSRAVLVGAVLLAAFSTFLLVIYIPLAVVRLYVLRDRVSVALVASMLAGTLLQIGGLAFGLTDRAFTVPRYEPLWALKSYVVWAVPHAILGYRFARPVDAGHGVGVLALIVLAWLVVIAALVVAVRKVTRPAWFLAAVAGAHSVGLLCMTIMSNGIITQRYLLPVELLLFTALVALLQPADHLSGMKALAPLAAFTAVVLVVSAFNYRWHDTHRAHSPVWSEQVQRGGGACKVSGRREVQIRSGPEPYFSLVTVPCHDLNRDLWCQEPFCVQINMPAATERRGPD